RVAAVAARADVAAEALAERLATAAAVAAVPAGEVEVVGDPLSGADRLHRGPGLDHFARDLVPGDAGKRRDAARRGDHADHRQPAAAGADPDEDLVRSGLRDGHFLQLQRCA